MPMSISFFTTSAAVHLEAGCQLGHLDLVADGDLELLFRLFFLIGAAHLVHGEPFLVGLSAVAAGIGAVVLLFQLLLVRLLIVFDTGAEVFEPFVVLGQIDGGGAGIDDADVAGALLFHAGFDLRLGLRRDGHTVVAGILILTAAEAILAAEAAAAGLP